MNHPMVTIADLARKSNREYTILTRSAADIYTFFFWLCSIYVYLQGISLLEKAAPSMVSVRASAIPEHKHYWQWGCCKTSAGCGSPILLRESPGERGRQGVFSACYLIEDGYFQKK